MQRLYLHALVAELLATLDADGQPFGTGAHLRIGELLQNLPENTAPEQLKTMLAPVLCTTKEEQQHFYEIFERSWKRISEVGVLEEEDILGLEATTENETQQSKLAEYFAYTAILFIIVGVFVWLRQNKELARNKPTRETITLNVGESGNYALALRSPDVVFKNECPKLDSSSIIVRWDSVGSNITYSQDHLRFYHTKIHYTAIRVGVDSFCLQVNPDVGSLRRRYTIVFNVLDTTNLPPPPPDTSLYEQRPIPHPRDLTQLEAPQPTALQQFLLDWEWPLKVAAILLAGLLVWFAARLWERNRRKLIA
ncbi:MAG: hypothetical protein H7246_13300, partial [Phycisphaerae bacterium]|nr:hypothetical protein [Saprospiraceae bacterium]